jgi:PAS domain S-box-containing protein
MLTKLCRKLKQTAKDTRKNTLTLGAFDTLPLTVAIIDPDGVIEHVNREWWRFAEANGIKHVAAVSEGVNYLAECRRAIQRGDSSAKEALDGIEAVIRSELSEFVLEYPCDSPEEKRWFLMNIRPIGEERDFLITHLNITRRKCAEYALSKSEKKYRRLYEDNPTIYFTVDPPGVIVSINEFGANQIGYNVENLVGRPVLNIVHPEDRAAVWEQFQYCLNNPGQAVSFEFRKLRKDGEVLWVRGSARALVEDDARKWLLVACEDITDRKSIEKELNSHAEKLERINLELRKVPSKLIAVQEEERRRLSVDLHDSVGQTLAALKYRMEHVVSSLQNRSSENALKIAEEFIPTLQQSIDEIRYIYMGLHPSMLDQLGLIATLEWLRNECMRILPQIHIELAVEVLEEEIPKNLTIPIFRITQEALNNVLKHSGAEWIDVALSKPGESFELIISDDGVGMDVHQVLQNRTTRSLGLTSMRERAEFSGGIFSIRSSPGKGTTVRVCWSTLEDSICD